MADSSMDSTLVSAIAAEVVEMLRPQLDQLTAQVKSAVTMAIADTEREQTQWLTVSQVADLLGISQRTVKRSVKLGKLPQPENICGRALRWRRSDIEAVGRL